MSEFNEPSENLAQTLERTLAKPERIVDAHALAYFAIPNNFKLEKVDTEGLLAHPLRAKAKTFLADHESFVNYVSKHTTPSTVVWCDFDPQKLRLKFTAVFDEHALGAPGWRSHVAVYEPDHSPEWKTWVGSNKQPKSQVEFAEFLEANEFDISSQEGMPTSLQMLTMATEFVARQDMMLKSTVRLQGGGVNLTYVADADTGTLEQMKLFEKFAIGLPVFWNGTPYRLDARLRYRQSQAKVNFHYDLIRADRVHQAASLELIDKVRAAIGDVPLFMGRGE
ncbi:MAG: DUF2303 family protein [Pseudomonadota bacterium]